MSLPADTAAANAFQAAAAAQASPNPAHRRPLAGLALALLPVVCLWARTLPMGAGVTRKAHIARRRLQRDGWPCKAGLIMSVNVSARQFKHPRRLDEVAEMIALAGCAAHRIELERTERATTAQPETAEATVHALKRMGVRLATDDVGTGHSPLASFKRFPVDGVKIDRSFVSDIPGDAGNAALTRAIIAMGHAPGLHVVAEGVERTDPLDCLHLQGCDAYQRYWPARPLPEDALAALRTSLPQPSPLAVAAH